MVVERDGRGEDAAATTEGQEQKVMKSSKPKLSLNLSGMFKKNKMGSSKVAPAESSTKTKKRKDKQKVADDYVESAREEVVTPKTEVKKMKVQPKRKAVRIS